MFMIIVNFGLILIIIAVSLWLVDRLFSVSGGRRSQPAPPLHTGPKDPPDLRSFESSGPNQDLPPNTPREQSISTGRNS